MIIFLCIVPYVCFTFLCWIKVFSGCFRQTFFHLGDKKVVAGCNDCRGICLGRLTNGCLIEVVVSTGLTVML